MLGGVQGAGKHEYNLSVACQSIETHFLRTVTIDVSDFDLRTCQEKATLGGGKGMFINVKINEF